jgi:hypothetical protein
VTIAGQTFTVAQPEAAPECTAQLAPASQNFGAPGGNGIVALTIGTRCNWSATSNADWLTVTSRSNGTGSASVTFNVAANATTASRRATIAVAGQTFTVTQDGLACSYSIAPGSQTVAAAGGSISVSVTAAASCSWSATTQTAWITVDSGASGTGNGTVVLKVDATSGGSRTGTVSIAGQTFTVTQAAQSCSYAIDPTTQSLAAIGGSGTIAVSAGSSCAWTATTNDSWITITTGGSGTGNGTVAYSVSANSGGARTGTVTVAGQTFTVNQAAQACSYAISASTQTVGAAGGTGSVAVTAGSSCSWTAAANDSWITVTSGAAGTGNGNVAFTVAANTGAARTGTLTIAGQSFTVNQAAQACTYTLNPTSRSSPAAGETTSVTMTAGSGCAWTSTSNASWIAVTAGATGTGNGTITLAIAANVGAARTGTVTIAGQTFTVSQAAVPCTFTISPTEQRFGNDGGRGTVSVTAAASCAWTAVSNVPWITVTSGGTGTGNGTVGFTVTANTGADRTGTVTIAGHIFTVTENHGH